MYITSQNFAQSQLTLISFLGDFIINMKSKTNDTSNIDIAFRIFSISEKLVSTSETLESLTTL